MIIGISGKIGSGKDTVGKIIQVLTYLKERDIPLSNSAIQYNLNTDYDKLDKNWEIKKFAYKLKQITSILTGISIEDLEKQEVKDNYLEEEWNIIKKLGEGSFYSNIHNSHLSDSYSEKMTVREFLQKLGTEAIRNNIHPKTWINALFVDYKPNNCVDKNYFNVEKIKMKKCPNNNPKCYPNWIITDMRFPNELEAIKSRKGITIRIERWVENYINSIQGNHSSEIALDAYQNWDYRINNNGTIEELVEKVKEILILEKII